MKQLFSLLILAIILFSCKNEPKKKEEKHPLETPKARKDYYEEYYPGTKQLKIEGPKDTKNKRHGIWKSYNPVGGLISMTEFKHGVKNGITIVNYDSGKTRYTGENINGQPSGIWRFYNADGTLAEEKNYNE